MKNNATNIQLNETYIKLALAIILAISLLSYSNSFNNELLNFDDNEYFENYPEIVNLSWQSVQKYFSNYYVLMYHPLPILSFAIQYHISGLNPVPFHLVNFAFHLFNIILVFFIIKRISNSTIGALLGTFIFAIHPMNVEAVSWMSARSSVMFGFFFLASLLSYLKYIQQKHYKWLIFSILLFLLSCFSKANAVTLSLAVVLFDWLYKRPLKPSVVLEKLPFFAISLIFGIITISNEGTTKNIGTGLDMFTWWDNIFLFSYSLSFYIFKLFAPINLSAIYTYPNKVDGLLPIEFYLSPLFLALIAFALYKLYQKNKIALFAPLFFLLVISVTLQIIPSRLFLAADRYCYLPYIGFLILLASYFNPKSPLNKIQQQKLIAIVLIFGIGFSFASHARNKVWNNTLSLVNDIIQKNGEAPYLSRAYGTRAQIKAKQNNKLAAIQDYTKAIELNPNESISWYNRGIVYFETNNFSEAIVNFKKAISLNYENFDLYNYLGLAYFQLKDYDNAIKYYKKSIELNNEFPLAYSNLGAALASKNQYTEAKEAFTNAIRINPNFIDAYKNRGIVYLRENNRIKACEDLMKVKLLGSSAVDELIKLNNCE